MQESKMIKDKPRSKGTVLGGEDNLYRIALACIMLYALIYSIVFVGGPSFFGDDTVYVNLANSVVKGNFVESQYIFSIRLLNIFPIAFFYELFGVSMLTSSAWCILSYVLTIAVAFYLGKELYNNNAGIISALLLTFFPLVVHISATVSDDIPVMFVASLAMLTLLRAQRKNSKWLYFVTGMLLVASPLVTPEGIIIIIVSFLYLVIEILRRKVRINRTTVHFLYGILFAGILLMIFNYVSSGDPLITLTVNTHFYSAVGQQNTIPSTNTDPSFYIDNMFSYNVLSTILNDFKSLNLNPLSIWQQIYTINYSITGFYFYALAIAVLYLLIKREKRAYYPIFFFTALFLYLEFGPMHISLTPFQYLLSYRLGRFLTLIAVPTVIIIGIAIARSFNKFNKGSKIKRRVALVLAPLFILFLISTAIPINTLWYNILYTERYDQLAIAQYLNQMRDTTRVYYTGAFASLPIYMRFDNLSRFFAYDQINDCHNIPNNTYVVIPKFQQIFNLNYTPNPSIECPAWRLVLYPQPNATFPDYITSTAQPFRAKLYYVPGNASMSGTTQSPTNTTNGTANNSSSSYPNLFNFFNLTGVGNMNKTTNRLSGFVAINNVSSVSVGTNKTVASPGEYVSVNVFFNGTFRWYQNFATTYYLSRPLINVHYYGVEPANETGKLLDQDNGPWYNLVSQSGEPHQLLFGNSNDTLLVHWIITPLANQTGKTIKICGGYFATYQNTTLQGGWGNLYNNLSYRQVRVINSSVIDIPSQNCANLYVS